MRQGQTDEVCNKMLISNDTAVGNLQGSVQSLSSGSRGGYGGSREPPFRGCNKKKVYLAQPDSKLKAEKHACL